MKVIDLNCDMGESFGPYTLGLDEEVIQLISSANIACGFHGGDPHVMEKTVRMAKENGVAIGAHVSYPDLVGFGRRNLDISSDDLRRDIIYQVGALQAFLDIHHLEMQHLKPHGAMGNMAFVDERIASTIVDTMLEIMPNKKLYVLPGTEAHKIAKQKNLNYVLEVFADRAYNDDLTLVSRKQEGAVIENPEEAAEHVLRMVKDNKVKTFDGQLIDIEAHSICVHGDTPTALSIVNAVRDLLIAEGIEIKSVNKWL